MEPIPSLQSRQNLFSLLLPFPTRGEVAGWADQLLLRATFLTRPPERGPSDSLHLTLGEWPRLPFTARIDRAHSDRARSASKEAGRPSHAPVSHDHLFALYFFHTPRLAGRSSPQLRASNEGLLWPRVPRARRALLIASHSHHTPSQSNTAPPHRRMEGPDRAAYRHRRLSR